MTEQAAVAAIDGGCRTLRLPTIRSRFGEIAAAAEREQLSYLGFLAELVMAECDDRDSRRAVRRMNAAGFPRDKRVDEFDFDANPNVPAATVHQLAGCAWVIGDSGTGPFSGPSLRRRSAVVLTRRGRRARRVRRVSLRSRCRVRGGR